MVVSECLVDMYVLLVTVDLEGNSHTDQYSSVCFLPLYFSSAVVQWVELQTLNKENPGLNPRLPCQTLGKFFHSTMLQFTQVCK